MAVTNTNSISGQSLASAGATLGVSSLTLQAGTTKVGFTAQLTLTNMRGLGDRSTRLWYAFVPANLTLTATAANAEALKLVAKCLELSDSMANGLVRYFQSPMWDNQGGQVILWVETAGIPATLTVTVNEL